MVDFVMLAVHCNAVTQVNPHCPVDLASLRLFCWVLHCCLNQLQALRMRLMLHLLHSWVPWFHLIRKFNPSLLSEFGCTTLPQVHMGHAAMWLPRVGGCIWVHIKLHVAHLVDPSKKV